MPNYYILFGIFLTKGILCQKRTIACEKNDFYSVLGNTAMFADKTMMIKDILETEPISRCFLITAPGRFGKSTNLAMILNFIEIPITKEGEILTVNDTIPFEKFSTSSLKVHEDEEFFNLHFGKYAVIYLDFNTGTLNLTSSLPLSEKKPILIAAIITAVRNSVMRYRNIVMRDSAGKKLIEELNSDEMPVDDLYTSLPKFCEILKAQLKTEVFLIVDEFEAVVREALLCDAEPYYFAQTMDALFASLLKCDDRKVEGAVISGISSLLGVRGESSIKAVLTSCPFLEDHKFWKYYGYTETEMEKVLTHLNVNDTEKGKIKEYYNGYLSRQKHNKVYPMYSLRRYFSAVAEDEPNPLQSYWADAVTIRGASFCLKNAKLREYVNLLIMNEPIPVLITHEIGHEELAQLGQLLAENSTFANLLKKQYSLYFSYLTESGLCSFLKDSRWVAVPNIETVDAAMKHIKNKFDRHNFNFPLLLAKRNNLLRTAFLPVINNIVTTKKHLTDLKTRLNSICFYESEMRLDEMYDSQMLKIDYQSYIFSLLRPICKRVKLAIRMKKMEPSSDEDETIGVADFAVINRHGNVTTVFEIKVNLPKVVFEKRTAAELQIQSYAFDSATQETWLLPYLKRLLINVDAKKGCVEIKSYPTAQLIVSTRLYENITSTEEPNRVIIV